MKSFKEKVFYLVGNEYEVIGDYINNKTKILMRHNNCGNEYEVSPTNFIQGKRCPICSRKAGASKQKKRTTESFAKEVKDLTDGEYEVIGEYVNANTKVMVRHNTCGHEYGILPRSFIRGNRCPKCAHKGSRKKRNPEIPIAKILNENNISNLEEKSKNRINKIKRQVIKFVKSNYPDENGIFIDSNDIIPGLNEIFDIYVPELELVINIDSLYFNSELYKNDNYHNMLTTVCKDYGLRLIHIFEDEWINNKSLVKDKLRTILYNNSRKIYARKCIVKVISPSEKNEFLNKNHIQGADNSAIKLGLYTNTKYYEEETLVAVMTFCKPRKALGQKSSDTVYDYELSRYAGIKRYNVIGGFSKLLKYFEKNYDWSSIITYADKRWSNGNLYIKCGFELLHESNPSYWYVNTNTMNKREYRYVYRKTALSKLFPNIYSDDKTEKEIMKEAGYLRIYDCGTMVFKYIKNND